MPSTHTPPCCPSFVPSVQPAVQFVRRLQLVELLWAWLPAALRRLLLRLADADGHADAQQGRIAVPDAVAHAALSDAVAVAHGLCDELCNALRHALLLDGRLALDDGHAGPDSFAFAVRLRVAVALHRGVALAGWDADRLADPRAEPLAVADALGACLSHTDGSARVAVAV